MPKFAMLASAALMVSLASASCAGPSPAVVKVGEREYGFDLSTPSVKAGQVTFAVQNHGALVHEMIVVKTNVAPDALPMDPKAPTLVDETAIPDTDGEADETSPGHTKTVTLGLSAGRYLLFCNQAGHYKAGMVAVFTVTP